MKPHRLISLLCLLCMAGLARAGEPRAYLTISGAPPGQYPALYDVLSADLARNASGPVHIVPWDGVWFWNHEPAGLHLQVDFSYYYGGREKRTLLTGIAARYAYRMDASGQVTVTYTDGDSLPVRAPFEFIWQEPVHYQLLGIDPHNPAVQITAPDAVKHEHAALQALAMDIGDTIRRALAKSDDAEP